MKVSCAAAGAALAQLALNANASTGAAGTPALLGGSKVQAFKVYVSVDMEGISGITCSDQTLRDGDRYAEGRELMAADMNACIEGCFAAGATEVVIRDGHGSGLNVDPAAIDARATLIQGTAAPYMEGADGAEAAILLGFHAKALTPDAVLHHTFSSLTIQGMWLNDREVGETGVLAAILAEHKVPVVMVSGDDKVCAEAREWIPGVVTCETKKGTGPQSAELVPLEAARRLIREKTEQALRKRKEIPCIAVSYPAKMRWDYLPKGHVRTYDPAFKPVANPRRVEKTGWSVEKMHLER